ncbi:nucleotide pyrophosphohydrolase [Candidatus Woesearchaeota archaeon]|nr:nucleotide pyrophosphohydrolase [Candidatus Woesearchaeota archaeon]
MEKLEDFIKRIIKFRDARDWKQFHNPKDVSLSLVLEANEVMEHFQWKNEKEITKHIIQNKTEIGNELADVLYWVLLMSHDLEIDILEALKRKLELNENKYPVEKAKGNHTKYNKL